jgi:hypothetical protein
MKHSYFFFIVSSLKFHHNCRKNVVLKWLPFKTILFARLNEPVRWLSLLLSNTEHHNHVMRVYHVWPDKYTESNTDSTMGCCSFSLLRHSLKITSEVFSQSKVWWTHLSTLRLFSHAYLLWEPAVTMSTLWIMMILSMLFEVVTFSTDFLSTIDLGWYHKFDLIELRWVLCFNFILLIMICMLLTKQDSTRQRCNILFMTENSWKLNSWYLCTVSNYMSPTVLYNTLMNCTNYF